jgi:subtilisin family serine protease
VRRPLPGLLTALATAVLTAAAVSAGPAGPLAEAAGDSARGAGAGARVTPHRWVVLYAEGATPAAARRAVALAGGTVVAENLDVGVATVTTTRQAFRSLTRRQPALAGVARDRVVGAVPRQRAASRADLEKALPVAGPPAPTAARTTGATGAAAEPLAGHQWDMRVLRTAEAHAVEAGDRRVLVGIVDTGVDGSHPDIAPVLDRERSRNFTVDIPTDPGGTELDGPCEHVGCKDPVDVDHGGHGTHVASVVAAPVNGRGIAGVAPGVRIVSLRAGQDSGFFFLQPTVDALTYAGRIGVDVLNLSFYTDPWLFNCASNPADSAEEQEEQRTIVTATQRAVDYAWKRGVTMIAAAGNDGLDLGAPGVDATSPDYPQSTGARTYSRTRVLDNATCLSMPSEAAHVLDVTATGPSGRKSAYSSYGTEQATVAAPGGDRLDGARAAPGNLVLGAYPRAVLRAEGLLAPDGTPLDSRVVRECVSGVCAWYRWLQGTSMAAPHAVGVAALVVSRHGGRDARDKTAMTLRPTVVERRLRASARDTACPTGGVQQYEDGTRHVCRGTSAFNGFFGDGVVDALRAVS